MYDGRPATSGLIVEDLTTAATSPLLFACLLFFITSTSTFYYLGKIRKDIAPAEQNYNNRQQS